MYLSLRHRPEPRAELGERPRSLRGIDPNVAYLGLTSLFTDISSEMVTAILPIYLTTQLAFSPTQFGAFDGAYQAVTALAAIAVASHADRRRRYKQLAGIGYGVSAGCKLALLAAGTRWLPATAALYTDRVGKGVRTAPRDALISLSSQPTRLAESFGVHRALDTTGALLGPVMAFAVLEVVPQSYDAVFVWSFCFAVVGLAILVLFVQNRSPSTSGGGAGAIGRRPWLRTTLQLLRLPRFRRVVVCGGLLGLLTLSDSFVLLTFQRRSNIDLRWFPLLFVGPSLVYLTLAIPAGRLADRVGRARVFVVGQVLLLTTYLVVALPSLGTWQLVPLFVLFGGFFAATDGVLAALASEALPEGSRTAGLAVVTTVVTLGNGVAALGYGLLWAIMGPQVTLAWFAGAVAVAAAISSSLLVRRAT